MFTGQNILTWQALHHEHTAAFIQADWESVAARNLASRTDLDRSRGMARIYKQTVLCTIATDPRFSLDHIRSYLEDDQTTLTCDVCDTALFEMTTLRNFKFVSLLLQYGRQPSPWWIFARFSGYYHPDYCALKPTITQDKRTLYFLLFDYGHSIDTYLEPLDHAARTEQYLHPLFSMSQDTKMSLYIDSTVSRLIYSYICGYQYPHMAWIKEYSKWKESFYF